MIFGRTRTGFRLIKAFKEARATSSGLRRGIQLGMDGRFVRFFAQYSVSTAEAAIRVVETLVPLRSTLNVS
jgi:hypothetical protein